ncbi:MAG: IS21 family transposase [Patescibacteria group bacterium]
MIDRQTRTAILALRAKGHGLREIAKALEVSRNSVRGVVADGGAEPVGTRRASAFDEHLESIRVYHAQCRGNMVRVLEKLQDELAGRGCKVEASYSALTRFCRENGIGVETKVPVGRIVTGPGAEMQHDTSPYTIVIAGKKVKRQCASLVLGYSRMLYMDFHEKFGRFECKVFLTDAFRYFGGTCGRCVIDNTSIVLACGSGKNAQVAPEVEAFEQRFGFRFMAHEIMDSDRKGKVERPFHYIENNFLVGRTFRSDADLNAQALAWVEKANRRRLREFKASPLELFAAEKPHLRDLPLHVPEIYRVWQRDVDAGSSVSVHGLKYPVPAAYIGKAVTVRETKNRMIVQDGHREIASHEKKSAGSPTAMPSTPVPRRSQATRIMEEEKLKAVGEGMCAYLLALQADRGPRYIWSIRRLCRLLCQYKTEDVAAAVAKAHEHRLFDIQRVETMLLQDIASRDYFLPLNEATEDYEKWPLYQQGALTPEPDLNAYAPKENADDRRDP